MFKITIKGIFFGVRRNCGFIFFFFLGGGGGGSLQSLTVLMGNFYIF